MERITLTGFPDNLNSPVFKGESPRPSPERNIPSKRAVSKDGAEGQFEEDDNDNLNTNDRFPSAEASSESKHGSPHHTISTLIDDVR